MTPPPPPKQECILSPPILNPFSDPRLVLWVLGSTWCTKMTGFMYTRVCRQYWRMNELLLLSGLHAHLTGKTSGTSFSVHLTLADCTSCNLQSTLFLFFFFLSCCNVTLAKWTCCIIFILFFYFDFQAYLLIQPSVDS